MLKDLGTVQAVSFSADPAHIARRFPPPWSVGDVDVEKKAKPPGCETDGRAFRMTAVPSFSMLILAPSKARHR